MPEKRTAKLQLMVEPSLIRRIDDYRFGARKGSRSSAMRDLIDQALAINKEKGSAEAPTSPSHGSNSPFQENADEQSGI